MKCPLCKIAINTHTQSLVCPHFTLDIPSDPTGGFRLPAEARDGIELAMLQRDREALLTYIEHPNPLVRSYASKIYNAMRDDSADDWRHGSSGDGY